MKREKSQYISQKRAEELATRLREAREKLGWSQSEMSRAVEATRGACSNWEKDNAHRMTLENAMRLCSQLGISLDFLAFGREGSSMLDKECLLKAVNVAERLAPRATVTQKSTIIDIAYAMCAEGEELKDPLILRLASLESR